MIVDRIEVEKRRGSDERESAAASGLVSTFATASTGAAISGLSGAAAESALLAWLGGGSLAAGGGGMALGSLMLGGIAVAPAIAVGGFVVSSSGQKALTQAARYAADVDVAIEKINALLDFHRRAEQRIDELRDVTQRIDAGAQRAIDSVFAVVETFDEDSDEHIGRLSMAILLSKALSELLQTRILDDTGLLDPTSAEVIARYRHLAED